MGHQKPRDNNRWNEVGRAECFDRDTNADMNFVNIGEILQRFSGAKVQH